MPAWSSPRASSAADISMPREATPRIVLSFSTAPVFGMRTPAGPNTPFMPARAFGAPHTTCTSPVPPASTTQTRSRSAFGCGSAETTRATTNPAERGGAVLDALDIVAEHDEPLGDLRRRRLGVEMRLEPGQRGFHAQRGPRTGDGMSSGRNP